MNENIFYIDAKTKIVDFLATEFDHFPLKLQNRFLNFFPKIVSYEEEGVKYKPSLLFTNNIDMIIKSLPSPSKIELFRDANEHMFASRLKALVPFCRLDWCIYIDIDEEETGTTFTYGIFRNINSIKECGLEDIIFQNDVLKNKSNKVHGIFCFPQNSWAATMKSLTGRTLNVNFALDIKTSNNWDVEIQEFVDASFFKLKTTAKKLAEIKTMYKNIFKNVLRSIVGTICVVIDKDSAENFMGGTEEGKDDFFEDGIWLKEPISLSKLFLQTNNYSEQKLRATADLFMTMLDMDGITIVDNTGQIRAYNVFVEANQRTSGAVIGGARKRAAYTIINSRKRGIVGLYFQSQDGEVFYASVKK